MFTNSKHFLTLSKKSIVLKIFLAVKNMKNGKKTNVSSMHIGSNGLERSKESGIDYKSGGEERVCSTSKEMHRLAAST